jgi:hypothetical protein
VPIIDHIQAIHLPDGQGRNELTTLACLRAGLELLANRIAHLEKPFQEEERVTNSQIMSVGNDPSLPPGAVALLPCFFHWFGVSVCNYVRLVGFLRGLAQGAYDRTALEDPAKFKLIVEQCDDYVTSVSEIAPVKLWRDKIAAHFAITAPRKASDNVALLDFSVMYPVGYDSGRFRVNVLSLSRSDASGSTHEASMPPWSVTEVFEHLSRRYWPAHQDVGPEAP